jgi:copper chaperone CopZ
MICGPPLAGLWYGEQMTNYSYMHLTAGRLRVKVAAVKGDDLRASELEQLLNKLAGITLAKANPTTGNVLAIFDPEITSHARILEALEEPGYLNKPRLAIRDAGSRFPDRVTDMVTNHIVQAAVQAVFERLISVLI